MHRILLSLLVAGVASCWAKPNIVLLFADDVRSFNVERISAVHVCMCDIGAFPV